MTKSPNAYTDHQAKAREVVNQQRCRNCGTIGDTCECEAEGGIRIAYPISGDELVSAIASALREAEAEHEKQRSGLVAQHAANRGRIAELELLVQCADTLAYILQGDLSEIEARPKTGMQYLEPPRAIALRNALGTYDRARSKLEGKSDA